MNYETRDTAELKINLFKLQKHPFFFILGTDHKMAKETHKGDVESIATRQSNKTHLKR